MPHDDILLTVDEVAQLLGKSSRTIQWMIGTGRLHAAKINKRGGKAYRIPLGALPEEYQALYWARQQKQSSGEVATAKTTETPAKSTDAPQPVTDEQNRINWEWFDQQPSGVQDRAKAANMAVQRYCELRKVGAPKGEAERVVRDELGVAPRTLRAMRKKIHPDQPHTWVPLLADRPRGAKESAEFTPEAWEHIKNTWGSQSKPALLDIYRRVLRVAPDKGWAVPDYRVVLARINALPHWWKVARREGEKALFDLYPTLQRDYTTLRVHELWCADGHKADVWCRWPDGTVSRPIMLGWMDVRTRVFLGWRMAKTETADLVRLSFRAAAEAAGAIPDAALLDNGRGFASKLLTGGTPTRFRFKVKEDDIPGILGMMGVTVHWALPGQGQSKPIESAWRIVTAAAKREEFRVSYCGSSPADRPEECDPAKAVPIALFEAAVKEELDAYHNRVHRGHGMDKRTPLQLFGEMIESTPVRVPTDAHLRLCLLAAEQKRLNSQNEFELLGNRYWTERCMDLDPRRAYVVRFDPDDAHQDIHVYDGARYLFSAAIHRRTGFRDQESAKQQQRNRAKALKTKKEAAAANLEYIRSHPLNHLVANDLPGLAAPKALPKPEVPQLVPIAVDSPTAQPREQRDQTSGVIVPIRPNVAETAETPPRREFTPEQDREILQRIIEGMRAERALRK